VRPGDPPVSGVAAAGRGRAAGGPGGRPGAAGSETVPDRPVQPAVREIGGPEGPEPTRYGDWEKGGRCTDF